MKRIPFVEEMRAARRAGRKTQTRRVGRCPYRVGDVLGIGEPHVLHIERSGSLPGAQLVCQYDDGTIRKIQIANDDEALRWQKKVTVGVKDDGWEMGGTRRSGRFLPDAFVRDRIRVTAIRREPLQALTEADAFAEGMRCSCGHHDALCGSSGLIAQFAALWDSLHGKVPGERWIDNPPVTVVSFDRC